MLLFELCKLLKEIEFENGCICDDKKFSLWMFDLDFLFYDDVICDLFV